MSPIAKLLRPGTWTTPVSLAVILIAGLLAYGSCLWGALIYDDAHSISANQPLRDLANIPEFFVDVSMFSSLDINMYRPVLLTSFAINYAQGDGAAWAFKVTDLLLHLAIAVMVFSMARRLAVPLVGATFAGALFAVHPLCSEAIHMASSRSEQLMVFGVCGAILAHDRTWRVAGVARFGWHGVAVVCCAIACGSKETGVLTPAFLLCWDWLRRTRAGLGLRAMLPSALAVVPVACVCVGYLLLRKQLLGAATMPELPPVTGGEVVMFGWGRDLATQLSTMAASAPRFLAQCFVPVGLSLDPPLYWHSQPWALMPMGGALLVVVWSYLGLRRPRQRAGMAMGTVLAWGTCFPWLVVPLNQPLAEHRAYGLVAGFSLALGAWLGTRAGSTAPDGKLEQEPEVMQPALTRGWLAWVPVGVCVLFAAQSAIHGLRFGSEEVLWRHTLAVNPLSFHAHWGLGMQRLVAGDAAQAQPLLATAHGLNPHYRTPHSQLVDATLALGAEEGAPYGALAHADALLEVDGANPYYRIQKAQALVQVAELCGRTEAAAEAEALALSCLDIAAPKALVFRVAASARHRQGDTEGAVKHLDESERRGLDYYTIFLQRAEYREELGDWAGAERDLLKAAQRAPSDPHVMGALEGLASRRAAAAPR